MIIDTGVHAWNRKMGARTAAATHASHVRPPDPSAQTSTSSSGPPTTALPDPWAGIPFAAPSSSFTHLRFWKARAGSVPFLDLTTAGRPWDIRPITSPQATMQAIATMNIT